jgi:hypothetical protein
MNGSNGKIVELLERMVAGQEHTNQRLDQAVERLDRLELGQRRLEAGQKRVERRLDHMLVFMGGKHADHERRLKALEKRVLKKAD